MQSDNSNERKAVNRYSPTTIVEDYSAITFLYNVERRFCSLCSTISRNVQLEETTSPTIRQAIAKRPQY